jgi:Cu/Zn superoxide dismutase
MLPLFCLFLLPLASGQQKTPAGAAPPVGPDQPPAAPRLAPNYPRAVVEMVPGAFNVTGSLLVIQSATGLFFTGLLFGLLPGRHAIHVHEFGRVGDKCAAAGAHFNPDRTTGHPAGHHMHAHQNGAMPGRHAGDLGHVETPVRGPTLVYRYELNRRFGSVSKST